MVGLAPLLCMDGCFVTGEPGVAPSALSVKSADSENREKCNVNISEIAAILKSSLTWSIAI